MAAPILIATAAVVAVKFALDAVEQYFPPLRIMREHSAYKLMPNKIPEMPELIAMRKFDEIDIVQYHDLSASNGYSYEYAEKLFIISEQLLSVGDYITLWRREKLSESALDERLRNLGLSIEDIYNAKKVTEYFPSPQDLVRFAVREVYTPSIVSKFGMMEDLPSKFVSEAKRAGLPQEQAENFWAAHWVLPSPLQGFKMLQRRIIKLPELELLLKSLDVMPFWRDALIQLSYNPLTRVDVRRMYRVGTLDEDGVYDSYLDTGYSPDKARLMQQFTLQYENRDNIGITRANVIKAYKEDLITEGELNTYLTSLGYNEHVVNFWSSLANFEKQEVDMKEVSDEYLSQYRLGLISVDELTNGLRSLDLPDSYVMKVVSRAVGKVSEKVKLPSVSDLTKWLSSETIDEGTFNNYMTQLGYREGDVINYLTQYRIDGGRGQRKYLTTKVYQGWLSSGVLSESEFTNITRSMGISSDDISRMIETAGGK